ncbi:hypothetical protein MSAN_01991600 [Mycena sanguinolenta]|uniref:Uncharacterized protein n=1 Tax=Mycena sanguinolenta TaxID=230812 RepID=A0A8H6XLD5_9AGAR|nr:hypothetical protein MSAN_01991600 [Mycena sanguinolenta]
MVGTEAHTVALPSRPHPPRAPTRALDPHLGILVLSLLPLLRLLLFFLLARPLLARPPLLARTSLLLPLPRTHPPSLAPRLAYYRRAMAHKRTLALVSKQWNQYAQPVLYETIWITRAAQAKALALTLLCQACLAAASQPPRAPRRPHPAPRPRPRTPTLPSGASSAACTSRRPSSSAAPPDDLRSILAYAPGLEVYSDFRSVRLRPPGAPAELLEALAMGGALKRLSWTNYDDPALVGLGMGLGMPMGSTTMGMGVGVGMGVGLGHMGGQLEYLELNFVSSEVSPSHAKHHLESSAALGLSLPALKTLKVALDNATFAVLSTWDLPALRNLSVLSADFSYAREGFRRFFAVHGKGLRQLELGHSSAHIEEHYLTAPPPAAGGNAGGAAGGLTLAEWCPHLEEFVCSADAAWDWTHPDWIAPHLLLPAHPTVTLIGIRNTDARLRDDYARLADGQGGGRGRRVLWAARAGGDVIEAGGVPAPAAGLSQRSFFMHHAPSAAHSGKGKGNGCEGAGEGGAVLGGRAGEMSGGGRVVGGLAGMECDEGRVEAGEAWTGIGGVKQSWLRVPIFVAFIPTSPRASPSSRPLDSVCGLVSGHFVPIRRLPALPHRHVAYGSFLLADTPPFPSPWSPIVAFFLVPVSVIGVSFLAVCVFVIASHRISSSLTLAHRVLHTASRARVSPPDLLIISPTANSHTRSSFPQNTRCLFFLFLSHPFYQLVSSLAR